MAISLNLSDFTLKQVLTINSGTYKLSYAGKLSLLFQAETVTFHLFNDHLNGWIERVGLFSNSSVLTFTSLTHTPTLFMAASNTTSSRFFNASTYPLTSSGDSLTTITAPTISNISTSEFCSFAPKTFYVSFNPSADTPVAVEAPCTKSISSSFNISNSVALPSHIQFTQTSSNSTQTFTVLSSASFGGANQLTYSSTLSNNETFNSETKSWNFSIIVFKCPDISCTSCTSYNSTAQRGICTACASNYEVLNE